MAQSHMEHKKKNAAPHVLICSICVKNNDWTAAARWCRVYCWGQHKQNRNLRLPRPHAGDCQVTPLLWTWIHPIHSKCPRPHHEPQGATGSGWSQLSPTPMPLQPTGFLSVSQNTVPSRVFALSLPGLFFPQISTLASLHLSLVSNVCHSGSPNSKSNA